ncbi:MAG: 30S ribosomal protein S20 [Candidatus Gallimonas sp.]
MPNIKSAKKRVLVTEKKTQQNKAIKSALKTSIKKFLAAVNAGDKEAATALYPETVSAIDSACAKGILHKNNADNKKSKLAKKLASLNA